MVVVLITVNFIIKVIAAPERPDTPTIQSSSIDAQTRDEDSTSTIDFNTFFTDPDVLRTTGPIVYTISVVKTGDPGFTQVGSFLSLSSSVLTIAPSFTDQGVYTITVTAQQCPGDPISAEFVLTINDKETPPILNSIVVDRSIDEESSGSIDFNGHFTDDDGSIAYSISAVKGGSDFPVANSFLSLSSGGVLNFAPSLTDQGSYTITVSATQGNSSPATDEFVLTVNNVDRPITQTSTIADISIDEG